ncbi:MAG: type II 3-dehydroquinate dehydratase [Hymenobacteraceae bacterium]|mgnify:CR=1 FL=1|nr:type II 3-dehydroquinate dehydratase [Hymenobacteraceae bacterium]MDX5397668.1 type II 3-dehydroquinate dehydratase [Hymenobacteraceae bacterium]MDX5443251.1 type II 3-dehydroquinate dehydratase [Hymenobacteraceae bacterium]MDX5513744.1 type II 3-dehydroquinate dehydratase [Hymenobacteraceae bacterium]
MKIQIINGPNLNLVGIREKSVYGSRSFDDYLKELHTDFPELELLYFQSNNEGELIDKLHEVGFTFDGIILNAGGYSHTSVALADAVAAISTQVVEVHISNIFAREAYRHKSLISAKAAGVICGFGLEGYRLALQHFLKFKPKKLGFSFNNT